MYLISSTKLRKAKAELENTRPYFKMIETEIKRFSEKWFIPYEDVKYEAFNFRDGELANENKLKENADYAAYKEATTDAMPKFKFNSSLIRDFKEELMPQIIPLLG